MPILRWRLPTWLLIGVHATVLLSQVAVGAEQGRTENSLSLKIVNWIKDLHHLDRVVAARDSLVAHGTEAIPYMIDHLKLNPGTSIEVVELSLVFPEIGEAAVSPLVEVIEEGDWTDNTDWSRAEAAAFILSRFDATASSAIPALVKMSTHRYKGLPITGHEDETMVASGRCWAIKAMVAISTRSPKVLDAVTEALLSDPQPSVRWTAAGELAKIESSTVESTLETALRTESDAEVCATIRRTLAKLGHATD